MIVKKIPNVATIAILDRELDHETFFLNDGDVATETTSQTTRSATKSRRNSTDLVASGRAVERRGRDVAEHHTYFDLWASSSLASSPPEGWSPQDIWLRVHDYFKT